MTEHDLTRIEAALAITLPGIYREFVVPYRVLACAANSDTELWDDPDRLIELNRELRAGVAFVRPWPHHLFALGRDDGGSTSAIDLNDPAAAVRWADRCHVDDFGSSQPIPFKAWAEQYLAELQGDLESNGIDPAGTPEARQRASDDSASAEGRFILLLVAVGVAVVIAMLGLVAWVGR